MADTRCGPVRCVVADGVATLTLDNPPLNVVYRGLTEALARTLDAIEQDDAVRAVVLTGAGKVFCAGSDIAEFRPLMAPGRIVPGKLALQHEVFGRLDDFPKPTVAALNGLAYGGGLEIAVCCDLIVADETARLALPEIKLGVFPGSGGPVRVTRRVGEGRAKELMFLGEPIDAATAQTWGLVNRVAPAGTALVVAQAMAATLARRPPQALALCKRAIDLSFDTTEDEALRQALPLSDLAFSSREAQEGVRAFFAKEAPRFPAPIILQDKE
jgi:enoyl-CoA hydratase/carnithine racemase